MFSLVMSLCLIKMTHNKDNDLIYFIVMFIAFVFTVATVIYKVSDYDVNGSVDVYMTAIEQETQTRINDCNQLQAKDYERFEEVKEGVRNNCGVQNLNDISHLTIGIIGGAYSILYNEFSLASVFIEAPKRKNKCLSSIDQFLMMCPERKSYFSQKNLQMLRDFESKQ